jgi:hypothetical protein
MPATVGEEAPALARTAVEAPTKPTADNDQGLLGGVDLPAWLRPVETKPEPTPELTAADARSLDWLTRLGPAEEETASVGDTTTGPRLPLPPGPVRSQAQLDSVALLERLGTTTFPDSKAAPQPVVPTLLQRLGTERVLHVLLLIGLLLVLTIPALSAPFQATTTVPDAQPLFERINQLTENDAVLVAYEWDARRINELRSVEQSVVQHVINRRVKVVSLSTDPQGSLLSYGLSDYLAAANYQPLGVDYLLLGYKPGGEFALRQIAQDFRSALVSDFDGIDRNIAPLATGELTGRPLDSIQSFRMFVVMADDPTDVQGWMEQVHTQAPDIPMVFLLPAEAGPVIQPYTTNPNVFYLAGSQGALAYNALTATEPAAQAQVLAESGQQRTNVLLYAGLLLAGLLITLLFNRPKERK